MGKADSIYAVGRLQLSGGHKLSLVVTGDNGAVDHAFNAAALDGKRNFLSDGLVLACRLVHGRIGAAHSIHLERLRTESAHDEVTVPVRRAVQVRLLSRAQIIAGDDDSVRMGMTVQVHELGLGERSS